MCIPFVSYLSEILYIFKNIWAKFIFVLKINIALSTKVIKNAQCLKNDTKKNLKMAKNRTFFDVSGLTGLIVIIVVMLSQPASVQK